MTKEEYNNQLNVLKKQYESAKDILQRRYATENNPYKVGDIIQDHVCTIKIEEIKLAHAYDGAYPECAYYGTRYTSDGKRPTKVPERKRIAQCNIIKQIKP